MSDSRIRALEQAAARGEPGAGEALRRVRCRAGDHAWSCRDTTGAVASYIWCVGCLERRPKDEHEVAVESYLAHLLAHLLERVREEQTRSFTNAFDVRRSEVERRERAVREVDRLRGDADTLTMALFDYRQAIAPHIVIALPVDRVVEPPAPTAT